MRRSSAAVVAAVAPVVLVWSLTAGATAASPTPPSSGGTLHVIATTPVFQGLDPQATYTAWPWELLRCCLVRALMAFPGVPDFPGTQPVPDLATGPPDVSTDGMTWTFHLRPGLHYAPPLQDVEITSGDIVRALLRAGDPGQILQDNTNAGWVYLRLIDGFDAYSSGRGGSTISGVTTPDAYTITIREVRPDRTIADLFAMPFTAPIPPSPSDPTAPLGVATGHPWKGGTGYGPFQVATGPYMFEGAGELDPSAPPAQQHPPTGMALEQNPDLNFYDNPGTITLVRNPSWSAATDPLRPAYPDRIEISMMPKLNPYEELAAGRTDTVIGEDPPPAVIRRFTTDPELQDRIVTSARAVTYFGTLNVAQPPFDDIHVRRAVVALMDPATLARLFFLTDSPGTATTHVVPDPLDAARLASWFPAGDAPVGSGLAIARSEMRASRYQGRCAGAACTVTVEIQPGFEMSPTDIPPAERYLRTALERIGITPTFIVTPDYPKPDPCFLPQKHVALCALGGWGVDYPDAGNMFVPFLSPGSGPSQTLLGATPEQLRSWRYDVRVVPSVDQDYARCAALEAGQASLCWARLDQLVTTGLAAAFPAYTPNAIRVHGARVTAFSLDQAFSEPSLDRIALSG